MTASVSPVARRGRLTLILCLAMFVSLACAPVSLADEAFSFGWRFAKGDHPEAIEPGFDDAAWEVVDLPHDWAISGPFDAEIDGSTGMLPWRGEGWYRKRFDLPAEAKGRRVLLLFDGVMANPEVFLNGRKVGSWRYGYNSFWIDATEAATFGASNLLAVHADTREHGSRWYPGAGIYRKVTLRLADPVHIPIWGVFVTTPKVTDQKASVHTQVEVRNSTDSAQSVTVETALFDPSGKEVARSSKPAKVPADSTEAIAIGLQVSDPQRWDVETPQLYRAASRVVVDGRETDRAETAFGIRTFEWTVDDGFHLNGRRVQLYGVNLHHDQGPLGAAFYPRAMERQLEIMKEMGVNALRTSHNAAAPEVLELCDRMGIVVFNELFDKYGPTASINCSTADFVNKYAEVEVRNFVLRDRNHPSVFLWSIGNEIPDLLANRDGQAPQHVAKMASYFRQYDTTRPTTMGAHIPNSALPGKGIWDALDTSGWNYSEKYMIARATYPKMPLIYSESASAFSTRGAYKLTMPEGKTDWGKDGLLTAYELTAASWADIPEKEFERMRKHTFVAGEFVWTGFDYLGEPTPIRGNYRTTDGREARSSYFGIVDLVGLPKDRYFLYRSHWRPDELTLHIAPHWNWHGHEGESVPVTVYTNGDEAELFVNGKSLGRRKKVDPDSLAADNLALGKRASASSEELKQDAGGNVQEENLAIKAIDGVASTRWCASDETVPQNWQVDLGEPQTVGFVSILWEKNAKNYRFDVETSTDGQAWTSLGSAGESKGNRTTFAFAPIKVRCLRANISETKPGCWASIREVEVKETARESGNPYYDIVDAYRLRWMDVPYAPGELKAVAYKDGKRLGEAVVKTAGAPAGLRVTADRERLSADGMDLCYVTLEMVDADGVVCPLAMDRIRFSVDGPARLVGLGNGDPLGMDCFTDDTHPLFYGKAVAILRSRRGETGTVTLTASSEDVGDASVTVRCVVGK